MNAQVKINDLKEAVREIVGGSASATLIDRLYRLLDAGMSNPGTLPEACAKVEKMVGLFVSNKTSALLAKRFDEMLRA